MFRSVNATWKVYLIVGLALLLALAAAGCTAKFSIPVTGPQQLYVPEIEEGSHLQSDLLTGKDNPLNRPARPEQFYVPEVAEGSRLEVDLHTGKPNPVIAPDASLDFGTSYWLIVGPAGGEPISVNP